MNTETTVISSISKPRRRKPINAIKPVTEMILHFIFMLYAILCLIPVFIVLGVSFTDQDTIYKYGYNIIPKKFSLDAYTYLLYDTGPILASYGVTILVTVVGTVIALTMTALFAFPLSRKDFAFRNFFSFFIFFTMIFGG